LRALHAATTKSVTDMENNRGQYPWEKPPDNLSGTPAPTRSTKTLEIHHHCDYGTGPR